jgi:hypothetical protein
MKLDHPPGRITRDPWKWSHIGMLADLNDTDSGFDIFNPAPALVAEGRAADIGDLRNGEHDAWLSRRVPGLFNR